MRRGRGAWSRVRWLLVAAAVVGAGLFGARALEPPTVDLPDRPSETLSVNAPTPDEAAAAVQWRPSARKSAGAGSPPRAPEAAPGRVIVKFRDGVSQAMKTAVRRQEGLEAVRGLGLARAELARVEGRSVAAAVRALERRPDVEYAEPDYKVQATGYADEPDFGRLWGLHNTGQSVQGATGTGNVDINGPEAAAVTLGNPNLVIAVIDDGVDFSHPDLSARRWVNPGESGAKAANGVDDDRNGYIDDVNGWDFYNGDRTVYDAADGGGHGTHVAGTIAGSVNGRGIAGVAPNVRIMALKFLGPEGGWTSDAIAAIEYATKKAVVISNNSWGGPGYSQALKDAIERSGQLVVAAAGNGGSDGVGDDNDTTPDYPASYASANILSVAAVDNRGALARFSNYGATSVDISAPGVNIYSSVPGGYAYYWGTSMAAPHATGVAALAKSVNSALSPASLKSIVMGSGKAAGATSGKTVTGRIVDARAALSRADTTAPVAKPPIQTLAVPSTLGTSTVPVRLTWPAATDSGSGVARYVLQRGVNGAYTTVPLASATSRSAVVSLAPGANTYRVRVRAYDRVGRASAWAYGPPFTVVDYQESAAALAYRGTWRSQAVSYTYGGRVRYASSAGPWAKLTFTGRNVSWVSRKAPGSGKAGVYLDGVRVATVDLYSTTSRARQTVFRRAVTPSMTHTLEIRPLGTAGRPRVDVDAFVVVK